MNDKKRVEEFINEGKLDQALQYLTNRLMEVEVIRGHGKSELFYLFGNVYRAKGEFHLAMNYYTQAIEANSESPAVEARKMLQNIMNFYNKDMYNH